MEQTAEQNVSPLHRSLASALGHHKSSELQKNFSQYASFVTEDTFYSN